MIRFAVLFDFCFLVIGFRFFGSWSLVFGF